MPEELNGKIDELAGQVGEVGKTVDEIKAILVGNTKNPDKQGLLERVRKVEEWIAHRKWYEKLFITVVVGQTIGLVFLLVKNIIIP